MRVVYLLVYLLYVTTLGCENNNSPTIFDDSTFPKPPDSSLIQTMNKFGLSRSCLTQKNTFVFYASRSFDTSFFLKLEYQKEAIAGVYYEVLPTYHNDINGHVDSNHQLLFFEGYSFTLDSSMWTKITSEISDILDNVATSENTDGCRDCAAYGLFYNSTFRQSSINNVSLFEQLYSLLKQLFITEFISNRKPIMKKSQGSPKDYF